MDELFRFVVVRAPDISAAGPRLPLEEPEGASLEEVVNSGQSNKVPTSVPWYEPLIQLREDLKNWKEEIFPNELAESLLGVSPLSLVSKDEWHRVRYSLSMGILEAKFLGGTARLVVQQLADLRRTMFLVEALANQECLSRKDALALLHAPIVIPASLIINTPQPSNSNNITSPPNVTAPTVATVKTDLQQSLDENLRVKQAAEALLTVPLEDMVALVPDSHVAISSSDGWDGVTKTITTKLPTSRSVVLTSGGYNALPSEVKATLSSLSLDPRVQSLQNVSARLHALRRNQGHTIAAKIESAVGSPRAILAGGTTFQFNIPLFPTGWADLAPSLSGTGFGFLLGPLVSLWPQSDGATKPKGWGLQGLLPSGVALLMVVRQQVLRYERGEVTYVENVMAGEKRSRDHLRRLTTEDIFTSENETSRIEERDLQTTDRMELVSEVEKTVRSQMEAKGEASLSASYGPTVQASVNGSVASSESREMSQRQALNFTKEVTERAVKSVSVRIRESRSRRVLEEIEERNHHSFQNAGREHISGVYQWLDKIVRFQVFEKGFRTLYDLVVPEPASFFLTAFQQANAGPKPRLKIPREFTISPAEIDEENYATLVAEYGATDVDPPPIPFITVAKAISNVREGAEEGGKKVLFAQVAELDIPDGYEAATAWVVGALAGSEGGMQQLAVTVGRSLTIFSNAGTVSAPMGGESGKIPVAALSLKTAIFSVAIEVECRVTEKAKDKWRLETHKRILAAYQKGLADAGAELDKLSLIAAQKVKGQAPEANQRLMATELKRAAISMLGNGRILLDGINEDSAGVPYVDTVTARQNEPLIRFLEQAFEWENMNYLFYPYFWGRKEPNLWRQKILIDDVDSAFSEFIRSGAARVQLPVRPGFEAAVDHFTKTGEPWLGGDLPDVTDAMYVPFADERARQLGQPEPDKEKPVGSAFEVRVPTSLLLLRDSNATLPSWRQEGSSWIES